MSLSQKKNEIDRLIKSFETEADRFHDIEFHTFLISNDKLLSENRKFRKKNHTIMLWQHVGQMRGRIDIKKYSDNLENSNLKWGIRGAELSQYGVIEGHATKQFVKMAKRAGALFSEREARKFKSRVVDEIRENELKKNPKSKSLASVNDNPLAIWLNYILYYLSQSYPNRELSHRIEPDLFTLSLLALEQLASELDIKKSDKSTADVSEVGFKVALSFPGEKRKYVSRVADELRSELGLDKVFYDLDYQAQIARPNTDILLQNIYHKQTDLVVVFLCEEYSNKQWCGLEWRSIRDLIKTKQDDKIMFVKFDDAEVDGLFSIDGYIDADKFTAAEVANFILERLEIL